MEINYNEIKKLPPIGAIMNVTDECNLRCKYCFTHPHPTQMSLETGIAAVKWLANNYEQYPDEYKREPTLNFFGGEPMLRYEDFVVPLMEWTDRNIHLSGGHKFHWGITTNGTLLNKERLRYLAARKDFQILFSCDGDAKTQNSQRRTKDNKDSFDMVEKNIDDLLYYFPYVTFRSTVTPESVADLFDNYMFAKKRGFSNYFFMPNCRESWELKDIQELAFQMSNICWVMYQDILSGNPICSYNDFTRFSLNFIIKPQKCPKINLHQCGFGCDCVGIATNGLITGCQERNTLESDDIFVIGDIFKGIDKDKHLKLLNSLLKQPSRLNGESLNCENCPIKDFCSSRLCASTNYDMTGNPCSSNNIMCYWHIILYQISKSICEIAALQDENAFAEFMIEAGKGNITM